MGKKLRNIIELCVLQIVVPLKSFKECILTNIKTINSTQNLKGISLRGGQFEKIAGSNKAVTEIIVVDDPDYIDLDKMDSKRDISHLNRAPRSQQVHGLKPSTTKTSSTINSKMESNIDSNMASNKNTPIDSNLDSNPDSNGKLEFNKQIEFEKDINAQENNIESIKKENSNLIPDPIINGKKEDYGDTKDILDKSRKERGKFKEEFQSDENMFQRTKRTIENSSDSHNNLEFNKDLLNQRVFEDFILKTQVIIKFLSRFLTCILLYFYIRFFRFFIIKNYNEIYIHYINKKFSNCIKPIFKLLTLLVPFLGILYFGPCIIKKMYLKIFYFIYISIIFLKDKKIIDVKKVFINFIELIFRYLLYNPIGQRFNHPLLTKGLINLRSIFIKDPLDVSINNNIVHFALDIFFAHKTEFRSLLKLQRMFKQYKDYCLTKNKSDAVIDYIISNKTKLRLVLPLLQKYNFGEEYRIKSNRFLCALYNIKKNYFGDLKSKIFTGSEDFKSDTLLFRLFNDITKFKYDEISLQEIDKSIFEGIVPDWINSYIPIAYAYNLDILKLKKIFSIHIPEYITNDTNYCKYFEYREIINNVFYKNKSILYISVIFILCILIIYLKKKFSINKKIESK